MPHMRILVPGDIDLEFAFDALLSKNDAHFSDKGTGKRADKFHGF